jgi:hypothetical protein
VIVIIDCGHFEMPTVGVNAYGAAFDQFIEASDVFGSGLESYYCDPRAANVSRNAGGLSLFGHVERRLSSDPR